MSGEPVNGESRRNFWHALLILGRVSNLPTVWSNCFAGWLLGGGGSWWMLFDVCFGASLLYLGGMYLNDAIDADFDRQHRKERPIPAGHIDVGTVWWFGLVFLVAGSALLMPLGMTPALLTTLLVASIILYDIVHKWIAFSPVIMAACRFWLFLLAASTGEDGVTGYSVWCAVVLAAYIVGLSYIARRESLASPVAAWPAYLLALPVVLTLLINNGDARWRAVILSVLLVAWAVNCLRHTFWTGKRNIGRTVSGLLAGIVLVDLLAIVLVDLPAIDGGTIWTGLGFVCLFALALLFQRYVPAT